MVKEKITVLSFDMGKGNTGWSVLEYDISNNRFKVLKTGLITASKFAGRAVNREEVKEYGEPVVTFAILEREIEKIVKAEKPDFAASESAWSKHHVNAYAALVLCIFVAAKTLRKYNLALHEISPAQAKACIAGNGRADKTQVLNAIKKNENIDVANVDLDSLTEHESDSISIGYTFCIQLLPALILRETE